MNTDGKTGIESGEHGGRNRFKNGKAKYSIIQDERKLY